MVEDLRYLGGHISTKGNLRNPTQSSRLVKALDQLKRLRYLPASHADKVKIILAKVFPGCLYGIEGGDLSDKQLATLAAAVVDAFHSNNNYHDTELTIQTLTNFGGKDLDPVSQILKRRVLELRRAIAKDPEKEKVARDIVALYATTTAKATMLRGIGPFGASPTKWYQPHEEDRAYEQADYPIPAGHPSSSHSITFRSNINAKGPVGLLLQSICRMGAAIDDHLAIKQYKEQPISIVHTPYQYLPLLVTTASKRASQKTAVGRKPVTKGLLEIDANTTKAATEGP